MLLKVVIIQTAKWLLEYAEPTMLHGNCALATAITLITLTKDTKPTKLRRNPHQHPMRTQEHRKHMPVSSLICRMIKYRLTSACSGSRYCQDTAQVWQQAQPLVAALEDEHRGGCVVCLAVFAVN